MNTSTTSPQMNFLKNKKSQTRLIYGILMGIILISIFSLYFVIGLGSFNPEDEREIGYEFLDNNSVVHIWNTQDDYFFEKDAGIQLTNHYESYWTRNIFCIGYYNASGWNKIKCSDELNDFEKSIETDNETFVNAILWKDISYGSYDLRLGIQYHLGLNDENLSITIYGKNLGIDIPFDLGFAWKITDVEIPKNIFGDRIRINKTYYSLDGNFDITFKDLNERIFNTIYDNDEINDSHTEISLNPIPTFRISDYTEFLKVDWNENLNYTVKMYGDGNQENFYVALLINAGHFNPGQEKSTTFQWIDAEGDYVGTWNLDDLNVNPHGITTNNTYIWVVDTTDDEVYIYDMDGTYTENHFDTNSDGADYPRAITNNGTHLFILEPVDMEVYQYTMGGTFMKKTGYNTSVTTSGMGLGVYDDYFYIGNGTYIFKFNNDFTDVSKFILNTSQTTQRDFVTDGTYFWVNDNNNRVFKYDMNGNYLSAWLYETGDEENYGITQNGTYFWDTGWNAEVHIYKMGGLDETPPTYSNVNHNTTIAGANVNFSITYDDDTALHPNGQWIFSTNNTGVWVNSSTTNFTTTSQIITNITILNTTVGETIGYRWYANDSAGNNNNTPIYTLTITSADSTPPNITINNPTTNTNYSTNSILFNITATDDTVVDSCWYSLNSGTTNVTMTNTTYVDDYTNTNSSMTQGSHTANFWCNDSLNNLNNSMSVSFFVDSIFPEFSIVYPTNDTNHTSNTINVNYTFSDTNPGYCWYTNDTNAVNTTLASCGTNITDITWSEGKHNVTIWINDTSGNQNSSIIFFFIDTINPLLNIVYPTNATNHTSNTININYTFTETNPSICWYSNDSMSSNTTLASCGTNITDITWSEGKHNVTIWINDTSGNQNSSIIFFTIDTTNPTITINSPLNQWYQSATILFNITTTDTNGIGTCEYTFSNGVTNYSMTNIGDEWNGTKTLTEGGHTVRFYCNDTFGNTNYTENETFYIDTYNPSISITNPTNNSNHSINTIDINYTATDTNLGSCWYTNDTMASNTTLASCGNITDITWTEGNHNVTIWANDSSGREGSETIFFFIDTTIPIPTMVFPTNTTYITNLSTLNYTFTETNPAFCWYSEDLGVTNSTPVTCGTNFSGLTSDEGTNTWTIYINDTSANENSTSITFQKDTGFPLISYGVGTEVNTSNLSQSHIYINVSVTETNEDTIVFKLYYSNGTLVNRTSYTDSRRLINWTGLNEGVYIYNVSVNDTSNNVNSTITRTLTLDTTYPQIKIITPSNNSAQTINMVNINYTRSDTNLDSCWYTRDSGVTNYTLASCTNITSVNWGEGTHNVRIYVNDSANNVNSSSVRFSISFPTGGQLPPNGGGGTTITPTIIGNTTIKIGWDYYLKGIKIDNFPIFLQLRNYYDGIKLKISIDNANYKINDLSIQDMMPTLLREYFSNLAYDVEPNEEKLLWESDIIKIKDLNNRDFTFIVDLVGVDEGNENIYLSGEQKVIISFFNDTETTTGTQQILDGGFRFDKDRIAIGLFVFALIIIFIFIYKDDKKKKRRNR